MLNFTNRWVPKFVTGTVPSLKAPENKDQEREDKVMPRVLFTFLGVAMNQLVQLASLLHKERATISTAEI